MDKTAITERPPLIRSPDNFTLPQDSPRGHLFTLTGGDCLHPGWAGGPGRLVGPTSWWSSACPTALPEASAFGECALLCNHQRLPLAWSSASSPAPGAPAAPSVGPCSSALLSQARPGGEHVFLDQISRVTDTTVGHTHLTHYLMNKIPRRGKKLGALWVQTGWKHQSNGRRNGLSASSFNLHSITPNPHQLSCFCF